MRARVCGLIAAILTAVACGHDPTAPTILVHNPPLSFPLGNSQSDTIQTVLSQALVVQVGNGPTGESNQARVVRFQSVPDSGQFRVLVEPLASGTPQPFLAETTDAGGLVATVVVLGQDAGPGQIIVTVPEFGYVDTARFTVNPGHAVAIFSAPNDTDAYVSGAVTLRSGAVDRYGNRRSDSVWYSVLSGPGTLNGATLTVQGYGPIQVVGSSDGYRDTLAVFGVPPGSIAAAGDATGIYTFNLDGSHYSELSTTYAGTLKWASGGTSLVFDQTVQGLYGATDLLLGVLSSNGQVSTLVNSGSVALAYPQYSRDGQWIYYDQYSTTQPMWRVHPDGTGNTLVNMASPERLQFPSPSPDGTQVSYILGSEIGDLKILTPSSGTAVDLGVKGVADVWSPTGNVIAYTTLSNTMAIIKSDGSGGMTLAPGPYGAQFDWSPDGQWIIARNTATTRLELIQVATRLVIPLGYTGTIGSPTWY